MSAPRTGGSILVANLLAQGVDAAFCVPGESYLPVLDALYDVRDRLRLVVCRHEGGASYMAEAYGKLTGRPGIALVTRGPGASNAAIGIHTAAQDSSPMIVFVGQVGGDFADREAFQEIDYRRMYGSSVKWAAQIDRADRIPEYVARAFRVAQSGRPGPVVLALPEDMLSATATVDDAARIAPTQLHPSAADVAALRSRLEQARAPMLVVGGSGWSASACADLARFAAANDLPAACAFRNQDLIDNDSVNYAGDLGIGPNPKLAARVREADVLLVVGERLGEMVTGGYSLLAVPDPVQTLIHVHPGADEVGKVYQPAMAIAASLPAFWAALAALPPIARPSWSGSAGTAHAEYLAWQTPRPMPGPLDLWQVVASMRERLPADAIVTGGAGNYATWMHRLYRYRRYRSQLAPYSGSMGYGVPAAIAAKVVHPGRTVVSWNGDGCFLMNGQELATAAQYRLAIVFVVIDNGMYGTIRMHQEKQYPGRVYGTDLANPDFAALARAYGAKAETVAGTAEFAPAFERALGHDGPSLLHLKIDPQAITMNATIDQLRAAAMSTSLQP
ncbi:MAG TPA: thiamine pyrophosphate-binding protein [Casimicrobiaceae bacterium]|nr:thiamine pyrophosphate-binding protein [Casimicrobiaceae bacterium]